MAEAKPDRTAEKFETARGNSNFFSIQNIMIAITIILGFVAMRDIDNNVGINLRAPTSWISPVAKHP